MKREALVVGINCYPMFEDSRDLKAAAKDAEAIAQLLEKYGDFSVKRLPALESDQEEQRKVDLQDTTNVADLETAIATQNRQQEVTRKVVDPKGIVRVEALEKAIKELFNPPDKQPPDTALLFFAGHGWRQEIDGSSEGFLLTSDAYPYPPRNKYGLSLKWLQEQLENSPVRQQIVWLDCCHSGEFLNFIKEEIKDCKEAERDRCFIAACRSFQVALANENGLLTEALLKGLKPKNYGSGVVKNYELENYINNRLKHTEQHPVIHNSGKEFILTDEAFENLVKNSHYERVCPYRSLAYFTRHHEDAQFFHGRETLTEELINRVKSGSNLIALLGASGIGKSSLLRAGLLYQLRRGHQIPGSDHWLFFEPFTPGSDPLEQLEQKIWKLLQERLPKELRQDPLEMLTRLSKCCDKGQRMILVIDQLEECFTLCQDKEKRQQFLTFLLDALKTTDNKLCIALGIRSDCWSKLEQDQEEFFHKISNPIKVPPLEQKEIEAAINEPAEKVGVIVRGELVTKIVEDLKGYSGSLPILESILTDVWEKAKNQADPIERITLELAIYKDAKVLEKTLENRAEQVYEKLSDEEKKVARRIFLELTEFYDDKLTDRQVYLQQLENSQHSLELLEKVSDKLASAEARLIVKAEDEQNGKTSLNIIHKSLILNWRRLQGWIKVYRDPIKTERYIEEKANKWKTSNETPDLLLHGTELKEAENYLEKHRDLGMLDKLAQDYIQKSRKVENERQEQKIKRNRFLTISMSGLAALASVFAVLAVGYSWQAKESLKGRIDALARFSSSLIDFDQRYESLVEAIQIEKLDISNVESDTQNSIFITLQKAFAGSGFVERHRLMLKSDANSVSFSPDGTIIASGDGDRTVNLWSSEGKFINSLPQKNWVNSVSFSPDGKMIAVASGKTVKLWSLKDECLKNLPSSYKTIDLWKVEDKCFQPIILSPSHQHQEFVNSVSFSRNGKMIATASKDKNVKLWTFKGKFITNLLHDEPVNSVSFSSDSKTIASASKKVVKLWSSEGKPLKSLPHGDWVNSVSFSPDGKIIASASYQTVNFWSLEDKCLKSYPDNDEAIKSWSSKDSCLRSLHHSKWVNSVSFRSDPDRSDKDNVLVSAGEDKNINVWSIKQEKSNSPQVELVQKVELLQTLRQQDNITSVSISPDGSIIASSIKNNKTISLWYKNKFPRPQFEQNKDEEKRDNNGVNSVSFSPDGKLVASAGQDQTVQIGTVDQIMKGDLSKSLSLPHQNDVASVSFSHDSKMIASASGKNVKLWTDKGKFIKCFLLNTPVTSVSFGHKSKIIASISGDGISLWSVDGKLHRSFPPPRSSSEANKCDKSVPSSDRFSVDKMTSVSFSHDDNMIVAATGDKTVKLWRLEEKEPPILLEHDNVYGVSFSDKAQMIATASNDKTVKLWDIKGKWLKTLPHDAPHDAPLRSVSFSPDGKMIAAASQDKIVKIWAVEGDLPSDFPPTLVGHENDVYGVSFSPDGKMIASAGLDNKVILWKLEDLKLDPLIDRACEWVGDFLKYNPKIEEKDKKPPLCK